MALGLADCGFAEISAGDYSGTMLAGMLPPLVAWSLAFSSLPPLGNVMSGVYDSYRQLRDSVGMPLSCRFASHDPSSFRTLPGNRSESECAAVCDLANDCSGFEHSGSKTQMCTLWLNGACSGTNECEIGLGWC